MASDSEAIQVRKRKARINERIYTGGEIDYISPTVSLWLPRMQDTDDDGPSPLRALTTQDNSHLPHALLIVYRVEISNVYTD